MITCCMTMMFNIKNMKHIFVRRVKRRTNSITFCIYVTGNKCNQGCHEIPKNVGIPCNL